MNKSCKIVYSKARKRCVVVSEIARAFVGRVQASRTASVSALMAALGADVMACSTPAWAESYTGVVDPVTGNVTTSAQTAAENANVLGEGAVATGKNSNAIGTGASAKGEDSIAIGSSASVTEGAWGSIAIGWGASVTKANSLAFGESSQATGNYSNAVGSHAQAAEYANAFGYTALATGVRAISLGNQTKATGDQSVTLGAYAEAWNENSVAIGALSIADENQTVSVGKSAASGRGRYERRIVNVAEGTAASNAATVSQTATVESDSGLLAVDGASTNGNGSKKYKLSLTMSNDVNGEAEGLVTNKTVKAALDALDFAFSSDLSGYAKLNGDNLSGEGSTFNAGKWAEALGGGMVGKDSNLLITGATLYGEVRPSTDGTHVKADQSTAANLKALDAQVVTNADDIGGLKDLSNITETGEGKVRTLAKEAVKLDDGAYTEVVSSDSVDGKTKTYQVNVKAEGLVAEGDDGIVKGGTVYAAIQSLKGETDSAINGLGAAYAKLNGDNLSGEGSTFNAGKWASALGGGVIGSVDTTNSNLLVTGQAVYDEVRPTADGTYVKIAQTTGANLAALDAQVKINADDIDGLKNLSNITETGEGKVRKLAKEAVQLDNGLYTEVEPSNSSDGKTTTYKVNVKAEGAVAEGDNGIVKGGVVFTAIQDLKSATDTAINGLGDVYAKLDGTNLDTASFNTGNWAAALGGGVIGGATVAKSNLLVTGSTVFAEVRPERNGNYVQTGWTAGANFLALDGQIKNIVDDVKKNADKISAVDGKADAAQAAAKTAQDTANTAVGKADAAQAEALKHSSVVSKNGHLTVVT